MAIICKQIVADVHDEPGKLSELTDRLKYAGLTIRALCGWGIAGRGHVMMITDDNAKACEAIGPVVDAVREEEVVCVKVANEPGALGEVAHKIGDKSIFINAIYAAPGDETHSLVVISTDNNALAAEAL